MAEQKILNIPVEQLENDDDIREAELVIFNNCSHGLGLKICGGYSADGTEQFGIFVKKILPGGLAEADGNLYEGDQILTVNGECLEGVTNETALSILRHAAASSRVEMIFTRDEQASSEYSAYLAQQFTKNKALSETSEGDESVHQPGLKPKRYGT